MYQFMFADTYNDCLKAYGGDKDTLAALAMDLAEVASDPFHSPRLQSHRVKKAVGDTYSSRAGRRGQRLIWRLVGQTIILLLFGEHDPVYRRAENLRLDADPSGTRLEVSDIDPRSGDRVVYRELKPQVGSLFLAWTDHELGTMGFNEREVAVLRTLQTDSDFLMLDGRMRARAFDIGLNLLTYGNPDGELAARDAELVREEEDATLTVPELDRMEEWQIQLQLESPGTRAELAPVSADSLAEVLSKPIEDWMVFLHPDQIGIVNRKFSGPARIRGGAGTGKTVVALHRALALARRGHQRILFTTYVKTLPPVLRNLYQRLEPESMDAVEFVHLHSWAYAYLKEKGAKIRVEPGAATNAFNKAWAMVAKPASSVVRRGISKNYCREEIDWVIKGRQIPDLESYLRIERTGRGTPLGADLRREIWNVFEHYQRRLKLEEVADFNDLLAGPLRIIDSTEFPAYDAVIIDEAQDLTEVGIRLCHALVGDRPDGLLIVGDGQQAVYPGGYSLRSAGISVTGRSELLRINYRNTAEILSAAVRILEGKDIDDIDQEIRGARDISCLRHGPPPVFEGFATEDDHDEGLVYEIHRAAEADKSNAGNFAVLVPTNRLALRFKRAIEELGYPALLLTDYDGSPSDSVKVGTYQRAKGLEFKHVFLPRADSASLGEAQGKQEDKDAYSERMDLMRRQLFVAMTRARDRLWVGWVGEPTALLNL